MVTGQGASGKVVFEVEVIEMKKTKKMRHNGAYVVLVAAIASMIIVTLFGLLIRKSLASTANIIVVFKPPLYVAEETY